MRKYHITVIFQPVIWLIENPVNYGSLPDIRCECFGSVLMPRRAVQESRSPGVTMKAQGPQIRSCNLPQGESHGQTSTKMRVQYQYEGFLEEKGAKLS